MPEEIQSEPTEETSSKKSTTASPPAPSASASLVKLLTIGAIAFVVWKYGIPLTQKATESLNPDTTDTTESTVEAAAEEVKAAKSNIRITPGFEKWEAEIRLQLEDWVGTGIAHELTHIGVNKQTGLMEIRYRTVVNGLTTAHKLYAKQDGIDGRYIQIEGDKEFLVYPPESE